MTTLTNRVVSIFDKKTSMRLTKSEWLILDNICMQEKIKRKKLFELIETHRDHKLGFTPAVRLFSLLYLNAITNIAAPNRAPDHFSSNIDKALNEMTL